MNVKVTTDKEHILSKHRTEHGSASLKEIYDAMEEYAQNVLRGYIDAQMENVKECREVEFAEWLAKNNYSAEYQHEPMWVKYHTNDQISTKDLFQIFQKEKVLG